MEENNTTYFKTRDIDEVNNKANNQQQFAYYLPATISEDKEAARGRRQEPK